MSELRPVMFFKWVAGKTFAKLENMVEEDREFTSQLLEPIDELLAEPSAAERDKYIRTLAVKKAKK